MSSQKNKFHAQPDNTGRNVCGMVSAQILKIERKQNGWLRKKLNFYVELELFTLPS